MKKRMKVAYVLAEGYVSHLNGLISQALTWKNALEELGHTVDLISMWNKNSWAAYDIVHYFGFSSYMAQHINRLYSTNARIIVSPVLDPGYPVWELWLLARLGYKHRFTNYYHSFREVRNKIRMVLLRSGFEQGYVTKGLGFSENRCAIAPLACDLATGNNIIKPKEDFCFHSSLLADERKNVKRLIDAAKKYKFMLILGGYLRTEAEVALIKSWIAGTPNIEYRGYLTNEELLDLYSRARVFALPSTNEGVGIVGLEAAAMGCDIVLTSYGGPKEYYNGMAKIVNPYRVDDIGQAVVDLLNGETMQPRLGEYIAEHYSPTNVAGQLEKLYQKIIHNGSIQ